MDIGARLRKLREDKHLSQGDIENRCGLLRCYISRVENGHTVPSIETLERLSGALEVPLFRLFCDDLEAAPVRAGNRSPASSDSDAPESDTDKRYFGEVRRLLSQAGQQERKFFLNMARRFTTR
ncbi:MAG TPA: helix-turn-helix transcriptional regulator [Terriglobia bacterium]|nr:helix-turn-helix transcriptional regulator [Terriglobia bacterium]